RWCPGAIEDGLLGPIGADVERERSAGRRQPVAFLILAGRLGAGIKRERSVGVVFEILVLRAERIASQRIGVEEMQVVVEGEGAKAPDRRHLAPRKGGGLG